MDSLNSHFLVMVGVAFILAGLYYYRDLNEGNAMGYHIPVIYSILYDRLLLLGGILFIIGFYLWVKRHLRFEGKQGSHPEGKA
jgi:hypothetical protein